MSSPTIHLISLIQVLLLSLEVETQLDSLARVLSLLSLPLISMWKDLDYRCVSAPHLCSCSATPSLLRGSWAPKLRASRLHSEHSYPLRHLPAKASSIVSSPQPPLFPSSQSMWCLLFSQQLLRKAGGCDGEEPTNAGLRLRRTGCPVALAGESCVAPDGPR